MGLPGVGNTVRSSAKNPSLWEMEWTNSDTGGTPVLDEAQSDQHPDISAAVALTDAGTGRTGVRFPKCLRAWVHALSFEAATPATAANNVRPIPVSVNAAAGTMEVRYVAANGGSAPIDPPEAGGRTRLTLKLEFV